MQTKELLAFQFTRDKYLKEKLNAKINWWKCEKKNYFLNYFKNLMKNAFEFLTNVHPQY